MSGRGTGDESGQRGGPPAEHLREVLERELGEVPPESPSEPPEPREPVPEPEPELEPEPSEESEWSGEPAADPDEASEALPDELETGDEGD